MLFHRADIRAGVKECQSTPGGVLLDVREKAEYRAGHIPGAVNLPLSRIGEARFEKNAPIFAYCLRGTRSLRAVSALKRMGYANVRSIGGVARYKDELGQG